MLRFTTIASGSGGNAALVSCGGTHVLLDAGVSAKRIAAGLGELGVTPEQLAAVLVTHEHSDHIGGLRVLAKRLRCPVLATEETGRKLLEKVPDLQDRFQAQEPGAGVELGRLWAQCFPTPHDAAGSVGWQVSDGTRRLVLCTDLGYITEEVERAVVGCDLLVCEANHDEDWVRSGPYPYHLKQRILGDRGHLSNEAGAELAAMAVQAGAGTVVLAHLSRENNTPVRARAVAVRRLRAMGCDPERDICLSVAPQSGLGQTYVLDGGREGAALC